ncbi:MAG: helix-turn-helix transcriptional regulator, partial [Phycisphaerales bacterium]|nr:helix-turn-helix transcriptional regulator [Phycisphaerales bacterium]
MTRQETRVVASMKSLRIRGDAHAGEIVQEARTSRTIGTAAERGHGHGHERGHGRGHGRGPAAAPRIFCQSSNFPVTPPPRRPPPYGRPAMHHRNNGSLGASILTNNDWADVAQTLAFTPRSLDLTRGIFDDRSAPEIARRLGIAPATARTHLRRLYDQLGIHGRAGLVVVVMTAHLSRRNAAPSVSRPEHGCDRDVIHSDDKQRAYTSGTRSHPEQIGRKDVDKPPP